MTGYQGTPARRPDNNPEQPCPFCASVHSDEFEIDLDRWAVACRTCGTIGPSAPTPRAARRRWTKRPLRPENGD